MIAHLPIGKPLGGGGDQVIANATAVTSGCRQGHRTEQGYELGKTIAESGRPGP